MKNYDVTIISNEEFAKITGQQPDFKDGFIVNDCDWWGALEKHLNRPIISVRPSGRESWHEVLILTTNGRVLQNGTSIKGNIKYVKRVLSDIFMEAENDEYEVFHNYVFPDLSVNELAELKEWLYENY